MPIKCLNSSCAYFSYGECGRRSQNDQLTQGCIDRVVPLGHGGVRMGDRELLEPSEQGLDKQALSRYVWHRWGKRGAAFLRSCIRRRMAP